MKKITMLFFLVFSLVIPRNNLLAQYANRANQDPCQINNDVFEAGESVTYKLYYNWNFVWLPAGEVTFKVEETTSEYHLIAIGKSYKSYEWFYRVRDRYDTYVDKETLLPRLSQKTLEEGRYRLYDKTELDQANGKATSWRGKSVQNTRLFEHEIDGCMHDILSIVYYCRNVDFSDFETGDLFPIKIFMDKKTYPLKVKYLGRENKKQIKGQGKFKTRIFSPEVIAGEVFTEEAQMKVWVSDDKNQIPLQIESPLTIGSVKAILKGYEGLKYDLDSKWD